jgi:flagellar motor switch protein FliM
LAERDAASESASKPAKAGVSTRDFTKPLRLSPRQLEALKTHVLTALPHGRDALKPFLRNEHELTLTAIEEISSDGLFANLAQPMALLCFEMDGQPGWLQVDPAAAIGAVEVALGQQAPAQPQLRAMTTVETSLFARMFASLIDALVDGWAPKPQKHRVIEDPDEVGSWRDGGAKAEARRLRLEIKFDGPGGASSMSAYLPGIDPKSVEETAQPAAALPARLGSAEVPLSDLLAIEVGDVIPLELPIGSELSVVVEEIPSLKAEFGHSGGQLALRITEIESSSNRAAKMQDMP